MGGRNTEGYPDPTANTAVGRVAKEKRRKEGGRKRCSYHRKLKNGQKVNCTDMTYEDFVSRLSKTNILQKQWSSTGRCRRDSRIISRMSAALSLES